MGPVRACSLSPLKFKMGVRDKSPTPINSSLILIPITATIRTQQILFVITVSLNIVSCEERGDGNLINLMGIWFIIRGK